MHGTTIKGLEGTICYDMISHDPAYHAHTNVFSTSACHARLRRNFSLAARKGRVTGNR